MFFSDLIFVTFLKILLFLKQKKCPLFSIFNQLVKSYSFSFLFFSHITVAHSYLRKPCPLHLHMCLKRKTEKTLKVKRRRFFRSIIISHISFFQFCHLPATYERFFGNNVFFFLRRIQIWETERSSEERKKEWR